MARQILKGSTDIQAVVRIVDSTNGTPELSVEHNTTGMDMAYRREGAASVAITEVALAALTTAHTDGGIEHIGDGYYRVDVPDAAFATGADHVLIHGTVTDMVVIGELLQLVDVNFEDGVRMGITALPNAAADAAGGLAISDAGGLDLDAILADTNELQGDDVPGLIATLDAVVDTVKVDTAAILVDTSTTIPGTITTIDGNVDAILVDTGTTIPGTISTIDTNVDSILVDTGTTLQAELDAIQAAVITNAAGVDIAADIIAMKADTAAILIDTNELQTDDVPGLIATLDAVVDTVKAETVLILADTNELQTDDVPGLIATLDAVVDTVKAETVLILADTAEIGTAGAGLTNIGTIATVTDLTNLPTIPANWLTASGLATDAVTEIANAMLPKTNTALNNVGFLMVLASDHVTAATGLVPVMTRSIDGGAFGAKDAGTTIAEVANGMYQVDLAAADTNGIEIIYRFAVATADDTFITIRFSA